MEQGSLPEGLLVVAPSYLCALALAVSSSRCN